MSKIAAAESLRNSLLEDSLSRSPRGSSIPPRESLGGPREEDYRSQVASSTPLRPVTTGARQLISEPSPVVTLAPPTRQTPTEAPSGVSASGAPITRVAEGFQVCCKIGFL